MPLSSSKLQARFHLLRKSAAETAALFSARIEADTAIREAVIPCPDDDAFWELVRAYDREVDRFKRAHEYADGQRINNAKIAGLLVRVMVRDGIDGLFVVPHDRFKDSGLDVAAGFFFVWHLTCAVLAIGQDRLPKDFRRDFMGAIAGCEDVSPELICLAMSAIRTAFGDPAVTLQD